MRKLIKKFRYIRAHVNSLILVVSRTGFETTTHLTRKVQTT